MLAPSVTRIIRRLILSHTYSNEDGEWDVEELWKAAAGLEPVLMPVAEVADLEEILDSHTWSDGPLTVREILDHVDRMADADLTYPIILTPEGWIGDGVHRLMKAWREGVERVLVVRLREMPPKKV